jgi:hypothetical protein
MKLADYCIHDIKSDVGARPAPNDTQSQDKGRRLPKDVLAL